MMVTLACDVTNLAVINRSFTGVHSVSTLFAYLLRITAIPPRWMSSCLPENSMTFDVPTLST